MKNIKLMVVGDIMLGRRVAKKMMKKGVKYPFKKVSGLLRKADITLANLECPISLDKSSPDDMKSILLEAPPKSSIGLEYAGIDIVSLANNHILDYGSKALKDTLDNLEKHGIKYVGLYYHHKKWRNRKINRFELIEKNDIRVAFLAYTSIIPGGFAPSPESPGVMSTLFFEKIIGKDIRDAKKEADIVVVSLHMGEEYKNQVEEYQVKYGHMCIDAGADVVVGHHPHVLEEVEEYKDGIIFYSLGNFIFDLEDTHDKDVERSAIAEITLEKKGIKAYKLIPVFIKDYQPRLLI